MIYDLIIIGGGPAGITAGIYAGRQRMKTLLMTKEYGGQMARKATEICNYPGFDKCTGPELIEKFVNHLEKQESVEIEFSEAEKITKDGAVFTVTSTQNNNFQAKSIIIATGADPRPLEAIGEKEFIGKGVGYCVTCDGPIFKNKDVVIVGGGNAGFEAALFMINYANKIYVLEYGPQVKADQINQNEAKKSDKIEVITNALVKEIKGKDFVEALVYRDVSKPDKSQGHFDGPATMPAEPALGGEEKTLQVQGVFIEIGTQPATSLAKGLVDFTKRDEIIIATETFATKTPGLFAVGDCNAGPYKQIVTAAGEGCKASLAAYDYLRTLK
ncbi:MAG: FAD-dependent oxidoreductase [Candidatus Staskawiczbacteria bacterium]|nr:FAD-dependent oxidoreductase [Candidatus Staskawiczbacteria bacterium]